MQKSYRLFFPYPPLSRPIELMLRKDNYLRKKCYSVAESWERTCQVEALFSSQSGRNLRTPHYISAHRSGGRSLRVRGVYAGFVVRGEFEMSPDTLHSLLRRGSWVRLEFYSTLCGANLAKNLSRIKNVIGRINRSKNKGNHFHGKTFTMLNMFWKAPSFIILGLRAKSWFH